MPVSSVTEHWIKQDAITINLNHFGDPDYLQVSVLAGAVVMAFKQDVIGYNAAHNYRTWPLQAANTYLETSSSVNVYARLTRSEVNASALIIYDPVLRDIEGREISYEEVEGEKKEVLGDPNPDYFFIYLGEISASLSESGMSVLRDWSVSFRFGSLDTNQFQNEEAGGEWTKMFRLNKVTDLIDVLKTFSNAVFKKLSIKRNDKEKPIVDLKRSIDSDEEVPVSDEIIPTTKYLHSVTDERFLRKDKDDRSVGTISSDKGFEVGDYVPGELGIGGIFKIDENGDSYIEVDKALFRKIAYFVEIMIKKLSHVGGSIILSPASMKCSKVEEHETYYRCYFENEHEGKTINQEFVVGDQARSQEFNIKEGLSQNVSNQYYWRLVVGVGSNYIDLSKTDCDSGSGIPLAGDDIVQLGNRDNPSRQRAIILSSYGEGTPSIIMYRGIKSYSMSDAKMPLRLSPDGNIIEGDFISKSGKNLEEMFLEAKVDWDKVLEQTDKEFSMWFFPYAPSADVVPEVDWVTPELKALHEEDLFYDKSTGLAWRYTYENGSYFWEIVTDAETIKALEKASKAQETADEKIRNFITEDNVLPPPPYDKGDRWSNANFVEGDVIHAEDDDMVCITPKAKGEEPSINDWRHASAMNSDTRHSYDAQIKNFGDSIQLTVEKTDKLTNDVTNLGLSIDGVSEELSIFASNTNGSISSLSLRVDGLSSRVYSAESNASSAFSQSATALSLTQKNFNSDGSVKANSSLEMFVENTASGAVSNIKLTADNVDINGIVKVSGSNSVKIGGWTVEENKLYAETGLSFVGTIDDYSISIEPSGMKVSYGDDFITAEFGANYASISDWGGLSALNIVNHKSVGAVGYTKMCALRVKGDPNDMGIIVEGAACAFRPSSGAVTSIHGLAVNARSNSESIQTNDDFIKVDRKTELPSPKDLLGKILFVKCSSRYTLTVPYCVLDNESSSDGSEDFKDEHMRAFISNGTYWFEMNLTNTW